MPWLKVPNLNLKNSKNLLALLVHRDHLDYEKDLIRLHSAIIIIQSGPNTKQSIIIIQRASLIAMKNIIIFDSVVFFKA